MTENKSDVVRDRIPEIIKFSGRDCAVNELSNFSFLPKLENKLKEVIEEYLENKELEGLADLLEIIYRIVELRGSSKDSLEVLRLNKKEVKGGFEKNLILLSPFKEKGSFPELHSIDPAESSRIVFKPENAQVIEKHGVRMRIYTTKFDCRNAAVLYQETETGHAEEFLHEISNFVYYIIEGRGTWTIEDKEYEVQAGDVVVVPAGKKFWFRGNLKQVCVTAPAWEEQYEHHIRNIEL
jgi:predicted house-cleaning noncanonical NTP pyrophosphatase (MazG superfamily)/mannose-6-phosphate isomerase-like protein (cupin superfamily)